MQAIVGLGNPGRAYAGTRHNAGFILADALADRWDLAPFRRYRVAEVTQGDAAGRSITLLKPRTYMNDSGIALGPLLADPTFSPAQDLLVLVDDVALLLGSFRLRARGSGGGHNGLESIETALESRAYPRLRIGVGPAPADLDDLAEFVLAPFTLAEAEILHELLPPLGDAVECWLTDGIERAMNRFNKRADPDG